MSTAPVLFLIFNRPDLTERSFESIQRAQPQRLFVAGDGPRPDREGEELLCIKTRSIIDRVDWDCEVQTLFREENLGCRQAVSSAITWFFEHVESGIILEDDCIANECFFAFCAELLERYSADERISLISGESYGDTADWEPCNSYSFSGIPLIWGWATWRRAWSQYEDEMKPLDGMVKRSWLQSFHLTPSLGNYWQRELIQARNGVFDTWDYRWFLSVWANNGLCIIPTSNMVSNSGFDDRATHTNEGPVSFSNRRLSEIEFPLRHPEELTRNYLLERYIALERLEFSFSEHVPAKVLARKITSGIAELTRRAIAKPLEVFRAEKALACEKRLSSDSLRNLDRDET